MAMKKEKTGKSTVTLLIAAAVCVLIVLVVTDVLHKAPKETDKYSVAMGTVITQRIFSSSDASSVCDGVCDVISSLEDEISWRKDTSFIYSLNNNNSSAVSKEMEDTLLLCRSVYGFSGGAFDITVGKLTTLWNIGEDNARVPKKSEIENALSFVDGSQVKTDNGFVTSNEGQFCDLGAVGKGLACDKAKKYLEETDISGAVISVGGSVLLYGENDKSKDWVVAVRDPSGESEDYMGTLSLSDCCVSTSGDYERVLVSGDNAYHHIIDPKTGYPADSALRSVTVV